MKLQELMGFVLVLSLSGLSGASQAEEQSWFPDPAREFEELRLKQLQTVQNSGDISPFTTDGCSGGQSKSWALFAQTLPGFMDHLGGQPPWESCCIVHDRVYWQGSAKDGYQRRKTADEELRQCVVDIGSQITPELSARYSIPEENVRQAFTLTADLIYQAVRTGGQPCSLLPWRWGYGWDNCAFARTSDIPVSFSNIKSDELVRFFNTAAWLDADQTTWHIPVHAWIYEPEDSRVRLGVFASLLEANYDLVVTDENQDIFARRVNLLIADNERGKRLVIRFADQEIELPVSTENGHAAGILKLSADEAESIANQGRLSFFAVLPQHDQRRFEGQVQLVPRQGLSVISDIDDTIKISEVTDHRQLIDNTFLKDFREVPGMSTLYQHLADHGTSIHYVSSSPWQLYDPLQEFMQSSGFPWASLNLKAVRFRDRTLFNLFRSGTETKPAQIEPILRQYPERRFILIGDSGEQDPEVYGDIARRYPAQIHRILIRNVDQSSAGDLRYKSAFRDTGDNWQLFDQPEEISVVDLLPDTERP